MKRTAYFDNGARKVKAQWILLPGWKWIHPFIFKNSDGLYSVTDSLCGCTLGIASTKAHAIRKAQHKIDKHTERAVAESMYKWIRKNGCLKGVPKKWYNRMEEKFPGLKEEYNQTSREELKCIILKKK